MVTKQLSSDFMQQIADEQAWKELSRDFCWTETLLDKYQDRLDWSEVVENRNIQWTIPMVQKFKKRIDWKTFSCYADEKFLTEETDRKSTRLNSSHANISYAVFCLK